jgi:hypothetical protein
VTHWLNRANTNGGVEDWVVLNLESRCVYNVTVLTNVVNDRLDGLLRVAKAV